MKKSAKVIKAIGKALWNALPWAGLLLWLCLLLSMPTLHAVERGEYKADIAALEAENDVYRSEIDLLKDEVEWLRSQVAPSTEEAK
jgi:cell division protein FtsB